MDDFQKNHPVLSDFSNFQIPLPLSFSSFLLVYTINTIISLFYMCVFSSLHSLLYTHSSLLLLEKKQNVLKSDKTNENNLTNSSLNKSNSQNLSKSSSSSAMINAVQYHKNDVNVLKKITLSLLKKNIYIYHYITNRIENDVCLNFQLLSNNNNCNKNFENIKYFYLFPYVENNNNNNKENRNEFYLSFNEEVYENEIINYFFPIFHQFDYLFDEIVSKETQNKTENINESISNMLLLFPKSILKKIYIIFVKQYIASNMNKEC
jgi:hypothetical protein